MRRVTGTIAAVAIIFAASTTSSLATTQSAPLLPPDSIEAQSKISPPPALGTPKFHQEMSTILWLQETRTPEQVHFVEKPLNLDRFAPIVSEEMFKVDGPALSVLLENAIDEVRNDYDAVKTIYDYPRPFEISSAVEAVGDARAVPSYPSGHAIRAIVYARLLTEVFPEKGDELMDLANRIGHGRAVAGVHYPMDVSSGQVLGHAYADAILANPTVQEAIADIRGIDRS
ncbi:phosphatase PAP2 family protein [Roseibium sp. SCPC15]|uniref:phosphatase PAP2 family protein n=1 Tax=Roseibium sp. SCP15 TaxID=3141376 RepID=UPI00333DBEBE